ncbi:MAG: hypothetical protein AABZ08_11560 [Planctomycetota bacterium]
MDCNRRFSQFTTVTIALLVLGSPALAWDEEGHVAVTRVAHRILPDRIPAWVKSPEVRVRLEYLCAEPDRWRGQNSLDLDHANNPEHYFDVEHLKDFDLTLKALPPLRREFTDLLATVRLKHADRFAPYLREGDKDYTKLVPGLLPYTISELQWKTASSWTTLKTYEEYRDYVTDDMIENAKQNVVYHMGILSHYIGDGSQPLHLTMHHHGWVGENPIGYTSDKKFHSYIDGGVLALHHINAESIATLPATPRKVSKDKYFEDICAYLNESFEKVEPLYAMEKSGELAKAPGKKFIEDRLSTGGEMLAGVWTAAFDGGHTDDFRVKRLLARGKVKDRTGGTRGKLDD